MHEWGRVGHDMERKCGFFIKKTISKIYIQIRKKEMLSWRRHKANEIKYQNKIKLQDITT